MSNEPVDFGAAAVALLMIVVVVWFVIVASGMSMTASSYSDSGVVSCILLLVPGLF